VVNSARNLHSSGRILRDSGRVDRAVEKFNGSLSPAP
jgi:hypothetical protein